MVDDINCFTIFNEYIKCKLLDYGESNHCSANSRERITSFSKCFCVSKIIFDFTQNFFFPNSIKSYECKCPRFGFNCPDPSAGYTIYDRFDMTGKSADVYDLLTSFENITLGLEAERIYARLLPVYMSDLIKKYISITDFIGTPNISTMRDNIVNAYNGECDEYYNFLCKIYFYICFCVRGSTSFKMVEIVSIYNKIAEFSPKVGNDIYEEFNTVLKGLMQNKKINDIVDENPENYLAGVYMLLNSISLKINAYCVFQSVLKHLKNAFSISDSHNPYQFKCFILKMEEQIKKFPVVSLK